MGTDIILNSPSIFMDKVRKLKSPCHISPHISFILPLSSTCFYDYHPFSLPFPFPFAHAPFPFPSRPLALSRSNRSPETSEAIYELPYALEHPFIN